MPCTPRMNEGAPLTHHVFEWEIQATLARKRRGELPEVALVAHRTQNVQRFDAVKQCRSANTSASASAGAGACTCTASTGTGKGTPIVDVVLEQFLHSGDAVRLDLLSIQINEMHAAAQHNPPARNNNQRQRTNQHKPARPSLPSHCMNSRRHSCDMHTVTRCQAERRRSLACYSQVE